MILYQVILRGYGIRENGKNSNLVNVSEIRSTYIVARRKADAGDYTDLIEFTQER